MNPPSIPYVQREDAIAGSACIGLEISEHHTETKSAATVEYGLEADVKCIWVRTIFAVMEKERAVLRMPDKLKPCPFCGGIPVSKAAT